MVKSDRRRQRRAKAAVAAQGSVAASNGHPPGLHQADPLVVIAAGQTAPMDADVYHEQRKLYCDLDKANAEQHDKAILQLTAGALALTVGFIQQIAPKPIAGTYVFLGLGILGLVASLFAIVLSFLTGQAACQRQIALLDQHYAEDIAPPQKNRMSTATRWLNGGSFVLFLFGTAFVLLFCWLNLPAAGAPAAQDQTPTGATDMATPGKRQPPASIPPQPSKLVQPPLPGHGAAPSSNPVTRPAGPPPTKK